MGHPGPLQDFAGEIWEGDTPPQRGAHGGSGGFKGSGGWLGLTNGLDLA
jgi:hypothetical protein